MGGRWARGLEAGQRVLKGMGLVVDRAQRRVTAFQAIDNAMFLIEVCGEPFEKRKDRVLIIVKHQGLADKHSRFAKPIKKDLLRLARRRDGGCDVKVGLKQAYGVVKYAKRNASRFEADFRR